MGARRAVWLLGLGLAALAPAGTAIVVGEAVAQTRESPTDMTPTDLTSMDLMSTNVAARRRSAMPSFDYDASLVDLQSRREGRVADRPAVVPDVKGFAEVEHGTSVFGRPAPVQADTSQALPPAPTIAAEPVPAAPMTVSTPAASPAPASPATPPAATVTTAATPDEAFAGAIAARLADGRGLWPARFPKREHDAVAAFYAARAGRPLWLADGAWNPAATSLIAALGRAAEDALDPADYPAPRLAPGLRPDPTAEFADAELRLSAVAILYARDARGGRIDPVRLSALITPKLDLPGADAVLAALSSAPDPGAALARYNPVYPGYLALKAKLAETRARQPSPPMARASRRQAAAPQAVNRQIIATLDDLPPPVTRGLYANPRLEGDIAANMERWRWLPAEVASRYIFVNVPEFRLRLMDEGRVVHETRVITGKPDTPTPIFSGSMEYAIVNPSWYIPPSIMKKEILPGLAADPSYAARRGYEVIRRGNQISVRQPPGERNALGFIKFMFPNQHAVYLHDTPNRSLFGSSRRAFSHGCVRVENPFGLADFVLGHDWPEARLKKLIGRGERTVRTPQPLPVHLAYFTLSVDELGEMQAFEDIYGYNQRVRAALGYGG